MSLNDDDLKQWVGENVNHRFPTKLPGMSAGEYWLLKMHFFLDIEARDRKVEIYVGEYWGSGRSMERSLNFAIGYMTTGKQYLSYPLARAYLNFKYYRITFVFAKSQYKTYSGNCNILQSSNDQQRFF